MDAAFSRGMNTLATIVSSALASVSGGNSALAPVSGGSQAFKSRFPDAPQLTPRCKVLGSLLAGLSPPGGEKAQQLARAYADECEPTPAQPTLQSLGFGRRP